MAGVIAKLVPQRKKRLWVRFDRTELRQFHAPMAAACTSAARNPGRIRGQMAARAVTLEGRLIGGPIVATPGWAGFWFTLPSRCSLPDSDGNVHITLWQAGPGGKTPYYFRMKDGGLFAFAGLWERWQQGEEPVESCTLITTEADGVVGPVHDRMPVILDSEHFARWLDPERGVTALKAMLAPLPDDWLTAHPVSRLVNNPRNEGPKCIEEVAGP